METETVSLGLQMTNLYTCSGLPLPPNPPLCLASHLSHFPICLSPVSHLSVILSVRFYSCSLTRISTMTLPKEVTDLVESWFKTCGKVELTAGLKATTHYSGFSECKVERAMKQQVAKIRGNICPQKTRDGFKKRKIGEPTCYDPEVAKL
jgi:hypothetical protein